MDDEQHQEQRLPDTATAGLRTSGRAGLLIVAAGLGLLGIIGLARRLARPQSAGHAADTD